MREILLHHAVLSFKHSMDHARELKYLQQGQVDRSGSRLILTSIQLRMLAIGDIHKQGHTNMESKSRMQIGSCHF
jgi:hypothetical protein